MTLRTPFGPAVSFLCAAAFVLAACGDQPASPTGSGGAGGAHDTSSTGANPTQTGTASTTTSAATTVTTSGSTGSSAPTCDQTQFTGQPVTGAMNTWVWVDVPEAKCRDGSSAGFAVRLKPNADKLFVFFEGGGACFDGTTCTFNPSSVMSKTGAPSVGIFDDTNAENPVKDWNAVFIPYCSGDVYSGTNTSGNPSGAPPNQVFLGSKNVDVFLQRLVPTFKDMKEVLWTGVSAGGFGSALTYTKALDAFCNQPVVLLDDSGPPMSDTYIPPCLQKKWRDLWKMYFPADCTDCVDAAGGGIVNFATYIATKYPTSHASIVSSTQDSVITRFYGYGKNNCTGSLFTPLSGQEYTMGLDELRTSYLAQAPNWSTFYINSTQHTWIGDNSFYSATAGGVKLTDFVKGMVDLAPAAQVGP